MTKNVNARALRDLLRHRRSLAFRGIVSRAPASLYRTGRAVAALHDVRDLMRDLPHVGPRRGEGYLLAPRRRPSTQRPERALPAQPHLHGREVLAEGPLHPVAER